jgi:flagellin
MAMIVNTNMASMVAQKNLQTVTARLQGNYSKLSSGLRITSGADDAAGLEISERLRSKVRAWGVAGRNTQDGISLTQTAEGALNEVNNMLSRMRELATQSANGTLSSTERTTLDNEFQELVSEIDRIASSTEFNGIQLLDGTVTSADFQVGIEDGDTISVNFQDTTATTLGLNSLDILTATDASTAISDIEDAITDVNAARGELGASMNRLQSAFVNTQTQRENLTAAESRIRDVDVASETADLTRNGILQQAAVSVLAQANVQPQLALRLLG